MLQERSVRIAYVTVNQTFATDSHEFFSLATMVPCDFPKVWHLCCISPKFSHCHELLDDAANDGIQLVSAGIYPFPTATNFWTIAANCGIQLASAGIFPSSVAFDSLWVVIQLSIQYELLSRHPSSHGSHLSIQSPIHCDCHPWPPTYVGRRWPPIYVGVGCHLV